MLGVDVSVLLMLFASIVRTDSFSNPVSSRHFSEVHVLWGIHHLLRDVLGYSGSRLQVFFSHCFKNVFFHLLAKPI